MIRYLSEQLLTVEEAQRLSGLHSPREERHQAAHIWAWQSVAGVLSQAVTEEQLEQAMRSLPRRRSPLP